MNFIDIHCHPSMKIYLFNRHIYKKFHPKGKNLSTNMFVNLPNMRLGGVNAAVSVHYLPEIALANGVFKSFVVGFFEWIEWLFNLFLRSKFEDRSKPQAPFFQMLKIIQKFEDDLGAANHISGKNDAVIARNFAEFEKFLADGKIVFIHSLESANCLGYKITDAQIILNEIEIFFNKGVCQFTIAHFFENVLVSSQGGIPPHIKGLINYNSENSYPKGYNETNGIAEKAINKMLDLGIVIDLVHSPQGVKDLVYRLNDARGDKKRPLVFSHTGIREVVLKHNPDFYYGDALYLPNSEDIIKINQCGGVLGVIFMGYWLKGIEDTSEALDVIVETIQFIYLICGNSYENIAIGSDLDGFTQVPQDLVGSNFMDELVDKLRKSGIPEIDIQNICFDNYKRVLKNGWGNTL